MPEGTSELLLKRPHKEKAELTYAQKEIRGEWEALQLVDKIARNKRIPVGEQTVIDIHKRVLGYFHSDIGGQYRESNPTITDGGFQSVDAEKVRGKMLNFGRDLEVRVAHLDHSVKGIERTIETAAWAHYEFVRIHPFSDGNGRTSRAIADLVMKRGGLFYITDWGDPVYYKDQLKKVDETGDIRHFERYLAGRLALRYDGEISRLIRNGASSNGSPALADLITRRQWLLRISESKADESL